MRATIGSPHKNAGIKKTFEDLVKSRTPSRGFMRLMEYNMPELTLESLVIENSVTKS